MDEARAVLARLERIEALERRGAAAAPLLQELRELAREAAAWAERERDPRACEAADALAAATEAHSCESPLGCALPAAVSPGDSAPAPVRR